MLEIFKSLGDENRLRILNVLINDELCVCELELILEMSQSNVSRHLSVLRNAKAIVPMKDAQWVHYKINEDFNKMNEPLLRFLEMGFEKEPIFIQDIKRCKIYKKSTYSCQDITSDKKRVLDYISENLDSNNRAAEIMTGGSRR